MWSLGAGEVARKKKAMWLYPQIVGFNPCERWGHSACYSHGLVYVFGGCCGGLHFSDVLVLNMETMVWSTLVTTGQEPGPRDSHSVILVGHKMIVFGGTNGSRKVNDLHILDLSTNEWIEPEFRGKPPSPRESHSATLVSNNKMVVFGGSGEGDANYLNDLHILDLESMQWTSPEVKGDIPVPRDSHTAVNVDNKLLVYGGDCGDRYHGSIDVLDMDNMTWSELNVQGFMPGVRAGHGAVSIGRKVYIIGGVGDKNYYNDVWVLDIVNCSWTQLDLCGHQPQGRFSHSTVVKDGAIIIYGGCGEDERPLNELLILQLETEQVNGHSNIPHCKIFGEKWISESRRRLRAIDDTTVDGSYKHKSESTQSVQFVSDNLHLKRRRTATSRAWEIESEQEEHSLSVSQHSSPSQSDHEQTPAAKSSDCGNGCQAIHLLKELNRTRSTGQPNPVLGNEKEFRNGIRMSKQQNGRLIPSCAQNMHCQPNQIEPVENLIGADVRGKVDGAFDSGYLLTASVNGKIFRGVLFAPGPGVASRGSILAHHSCSHAPHYIVPPPLPTSSHVETLTRSQPPMAIPIQNPGSFHHTHVNRPYRVVRASPPLIKEPKQRSDLQGVVLSLGGPGSGRG